MKWPQIHASFLQILDHIAQVGNWPCQSIQVDDDKHNRNWTDLASYIFRLTSEAESIFDENGLRSVLSKLVREDITHVIALATDEVRREFIHKEATQVGFKVKAEPLKTDAINLPQLSTPRRSIGRTEK